MSIDFELLREEFEFRFGEAPRWGARAPGRVNLIGEHIDYNGGFVLPAALNREIGMLAAPSQDGRFHLWSKTFNQGFEWGPGLPAQPSEQGWPNYFIAVLDQLLKRGIQPSPVEAIIDGDVQTGAGLSSSAAFEVCAAHLLLRACGASLDGTQIALLSQAAENSHWVGMQCGIMDQFISANARAGHALRLDCRTLEFSHAPMDDSKAGLLIIHSTVRRELVKSAYNERRAQCEEALALLNKATGQTHELLAQYSEADLQQNAAALPEIIRHRARHVVAEQARVLEFERMLAMGSLNRAGELLNQSHISLRDDYEVSCDELDALHEIANRVPGVYGCRMTGAGFGGCAVALVEPTHLEPAAESISSQFEIKRGVRPWTLTSPLCDGALAWSLC